MLAVSLECLDLPSKQQTGHFSSYHFLCMRKCARVCMDVCMCAQSTDQVITISLHMRVCVCMSVKCVCVVIGSVCL